MEDRFAYQLSLLMAIGLMFFCTRVVVNELIKYISNNVNREGRENIEVVGDEGYIISIEITIIIRNGFVENNRYPTESADVTYQ